MLLSPLFTPPVPAPTCSPLRLALFFATEAWGKVKGFWTLREGPEEGRKGDVEGTGCPGGPGDMQAPVG